MTGLSNFTENIVSIYNLMTAYQDEEFQKMDNTIILKVPMLFRLESM